MKKLFILVALVFSIAKVNAQQEILVSQYLFTPYLINPAVGGINKYFTGSFMNRSQWVGFAGAPVSNAITVEGAIPSDERMGVGLTIANDRIGRTNQTDILGSYSYHIKLDNKDQLSFGAKMGISNYNNDLSAGNYWDNSDNVINNSKTSVWVPKFGLGAFYLNKAYYVGLSVPTLLDYDKYKLYNLKQHIYLYGGYNYDINAQWVLRPSALIKFTPSAPIQTDLNCRITYNSLITGGLSYRFGDFKNGSAIIIMAEYHANKNLRIGYAYDLSFANVTKGVRITKYSNGTHEIVAAYSLVKGNKVKPKFTN